MSFITTGLPIKTLNNDGYYYNTYRIHITVHPCRRGDPSLVVTLGTRSPPKNATELEEKTPNRILYIMQCSPMHIPYNSSYTYIYIYMIFSPVISHLNAHSPLRHRYAIFEAVPPLIRTTG